MITHGGTKFRLAPGKVQSEQHGRAERAASISRRPAPLALLPMRRAIPAVCRLHRAAGRPKAVGRALAAHRAAPRPGGIDGWGRFVHIGQSTAPRRALGSDRRHADAARSSRSPWAISPSQQCAWPLPPQSSQGTLSESSTGGRAGSPGMTPITGKLSPQTQPRPWHVSQIIVAPSPYFLPPPLIAYGPAQRRRADISSPILVPGRFDTESAIAGATKALAASFTAVPSRPHAAASTAIRHA